MVSGYGRAELPGAAWAYNDHAIQLYALSLEKVFGQPLDTALRERLGALGFEDGAFFGSRRGLGVTASTRDFARLGWLWLNNGQWNGKSVIARKRIKECFRQGVPSELPRTAAPGKPFAESG